MASKSRSKPKQSGKFSPAHSSSPGTPPAPFSKAPEKLVPFLSQLPSNHVYITHVDTTARDFKKNIFLVPVATNVAILAFVLWRAVKVAPFYANLFMAAGGYQNHIFMDPKNMTWPAIIQKIGGSFLNIIFDFLLYTVVLQWPKAFFIGSDLGTPVEWRWAVGFRDREIIVRRSKRWDESIGNVVADQTIPGSRQFSANARFAVSKEYMIGRTGYSMLNKDWDLDFLAMTDATTLVDAKDFSLIDFNTAVYLHSEVYGWLVFETQDESTPDEEAQRRKIIAFKDELTALGKENLFFKWIELIQYESSQPGGFGPERQAKTIETAKAMFEAQGVNFEAFWKKIGGMDGLPGMEQFA